MNVYHNCKSGLGPGVFSQCGDSEGSGTCQAEANCHLLASDASRVEQKCFVGGVAFLGSRLSGMQRSASSGRNLRSKSCEKWP